MVCKSLGHLQNGSFPENQINRWHKVGTLETRNRVKDLDFSLLWAHCPAIIEIFLFCMWARLCQAICQIFAGAKCVINTWNIKSQQLFSGLPSYIEQIVFQISWWAINQDQKRVITKVVFSLEELPRVSKISKFSRTWSVGFQLFSTFGKLSRISRLSSFSRNSRNWKSVKRPIFQKQGLNLKVRTP